MSSLSLSGIIDVLVETQAAVTYQRGFNTAVILGDFNASYPVEVSSEAVFYESLSEVLQTFGQDSDIYKTAALYFGQSAVPKGVYVATLQNPARLPGSTAEKLQEAVARIRIANSEWYVCIPTVSVINANYSISSPEGEDAEVVYTNLDAACETIQSSEIESILALSLTGSKETDYSGADLVVLQGLKSKGYSRTIVQLEDLTRITSDAGKTPVGAVIGYAMGRNNRLSNAYTLAYKSLAGISPVDYMASVELNAILNNNGNIYVTQGYYYNLFRQGKMLSGDNFDEVVYIDMLVDSIKSAVMNVLIGNAKVPQTESGINMIKSSIISVLERFRAVQFIAPGIWNGPDVLALESGDALSSGYLVQFESLSSQTAVERSLRVAPPCYICIKLSGAIEHIAISLIVNR